MPRISSIGQSFHKVHNFDRFWDFACLVDYVYLSVLINSVLELPLKLFINLINSCTLLDRVKAA